MTAEPTSVRRLRLLPALVRDRLMPTDRGFDLLIGFALCLLGLLVVTCVTSQVRDGRWPVAGDAHYVFATARSIAYDGDLDLQNQLAVMGDRYRFADRAADDGFVPPPRELGASLVMVPGLWLHHLVRAPSRLEPTFAAIGPSLALGLVYLLTAAALRRRLVHPSPRARRRIATVTVLGGVLPFYALVSAGYSHATDAVICAALVLTLLDDPQLRRPVVIGGLLGAAVLVRLQNALWLAWPVTVAVLEARGLTPDARSKRAGRILTIAAIGAMGGVPMLAVDVLHAGSPGGAIRWGLGFFEPREGWRGTAEVLWGRHGLWSWTPLWLLGSLGLALRRDLLPALVVTIAMVLLMAITPDPDGGFAFGARRLCGLTILSGLGLAALWAELHRLWGRIPHGFRVAVAACVVSNLYRTTAALLGLLRLG